MLGDIWIKHQNACHAPKHSGRAALPLERGVDCITIDSDWWAMDQKRYADIRFIPARAGNIAAPDAAGTAKAVLNYFTGVCT
jgi:hypothetical protein